MTAPRVNHRPTPSDVRNPTNNQLAATCTHCHHPLPDAGQWAWTNQGPVCHPHQRTDRADCYRHWTHR